MRLLFIALLLTLVACGESPRPKTAEELKMELKLNEELSPLLYLKAPKATIEKLEKKVRNGGLFRKAEYAPDGAIFRSSIKNTATLAKYKDLQIRITYYSRTKTVIKRENLVVYDYYPPNKTTPLQIRLKEIPSAYDSFSYEIIGATATN